MTRSGGTIRVARGMNGVAAAVGQPSQRGEPHVGSRWQGIESDLGDTND